MKDHPEELISLNASLLPRIHINLATYKDMNIEEQLYLRASVIEKLNAAQKYLDDKHASQNLRIELRSAFRTLQGLEVLKKEHEDRYDKWKSEGKLGEYKDRGQYVNSMLAVPASGKEPGHMTGGAVDVRLCGPNGERVHLEESTDIAGHIPRNLQIVTRSSEVAAKYPEMMRLRLILLEAMEKQGFHNNKDEYWHYSYGDADWAKANMCDSLYKIVESKLE